jgi:serine/threonine protein kinase
MILELDASHVSIVAELPELAPSAPLPLPANFGRYRLTHLLAVGGMAQIYLAKSFGAEGFVKSLVIKRLDPKLAQRKFFTDLFINEAKLLVTLSHGNIVPVFDFGRVGDDLYMAMEYVHGASLGRLLRRLGDSGRALGLHLSAFVAMEVCKGLDYAHRKRDPRGNSAGIVHRDIKPSNILISLEGEVKIVDFGVAKLAGRLESSSPLAGTLGYMSPEQANQKHVDARTDIFSTALVLHELLAGRRVYQADSFDDALELAKRAEIPELPAQIPGELRAVVKRAAAREPDDRFSSAHAMEQELSTYLLLHRSASEMLESRSPSSQLARLMREIPLDSRVEQEVGETIDPLLPPLGRAPADDDRPASIAMDGEPDLQLIQEAAETFHSEFFTRVLKQELSPLAWATPRSRKVVFGSIAALVLLIGAGALLYSGALTRSPSGADVMSRRKPAGVASPPSRPRGRTTRASAEREGQAATDRVGRATSVVADARVPRSAPKPTITSAVAGLVQRADAGSVVDAADRRARRRPRVGYLNLNSIPWTNVTVDGRRLSRTTPILRLRLAPGVHQIQLENPEEELKHSLKVRVRAGATTWKVVRLRRGRSSPKIPIHGPGTRDASNVE